MSSMSWSISRRISCIRARTASASGASFMGGILATSTWSGCRGASSGTQQQRYHDTSDQTCTETRSQRLSGPIADEAFRLVIASAHLVGSLLGRMLHGLGSVLRIVEYRFDRRADRRGSTPGYLLQILLNRFAPFASLALNDADNLVRVCRTTGANRRRSTVPISGAVCP